MLVNFKMYPAKKRVKIAPPVITKMKLEWRIALAAFLGSTKTKKANKNAKNASPANIA